MKTIATLLFLIALAFVARNILIPQVVQVKPIREVVRPVFHRMEIKPVHRKVNDITEVALNKFGLSSTNLVRVIADVVDFQPPTHYDCYLSGRVPKKNNTFERVMMSFQLENNFLITKLSVNSNSIPLPEPIDGIPLGNGGSMEDIDVVIYPASESNVYFYFGSGYLHKDVALNGDRLKVTLRRDRGLIFNEFNGKASGLLARAEVR